MKLLLKKYANTVLIIIAVLGFRRINVDQFSRLYSNLKSFRVFYVRSIPLYLRVGGRLVLGRFMFFIYYVYCFSIVYYLVALSPSSPSPLGA
jgi:hypothetical protein